jgi:exopolysaccharide production protein ExoZ
MQPKQHFAGLDLVRFFAACLVMTFHLGVVSWRLPISANYGVVNAPDYPELSIFDIGWVGVEIFFVLSGFVIAQSADGKSAYRFLRGRAGRLLPAIWICATITLFAVLYFGMKPLGPVWSSYIKTMVVYPNGPWISNVYWTLIVEIFFYGSVFCILSCNAFKHIELFSGLLIVCSGSYLVGVTWLNWAPIHAYFLAQHGCFFGLGILIWLVSAKGISTQRMTLAGVALAGCLVEICFVGNGQLVGTAFWLAPLVWVIAVAAICASLVVPVNSSKFVQTLGLITYPLYLVHEKVGAGILRVAPWTGRWLALFLAVSGVVSISFLVVMVEPFIRRRLEGAIDWLATRCVPRTIFAVISRNTVAVKI